MYFTEEMRGTICKMIRRNRKEITVKESRGQPINGALKQAIVR